MSLLFTFGRILVPPIPYLLALFAAFLAGVAWQDAQASPRLRRNLFLAALSLGVVDWALVFALPRLGLSYGPVGATLA